MSKPEPPRSLAAFEEALRKAYSPTQYDRQQVHEALQRTLMDPQPRPDIEQLASAAQPHLLARIFGTSHPFLKQAAALIAAAGAGAAIALTQAPRFQRQDAAAESTAPERTRVAPLSAAAEQPLQQQPSSIASSIREPAAAVRPSEPPSTPTKASLLPRRRSAQANQRELPAASTAPAVSVSPAVNGQDERSREDPDGLQALEEFAPVDTVAPPAADTRSTLAKELELVRAASQSLDRGEALVALRSLAEHARQFPEGTLAIERRGLELIARCTLQPRAQLRSEVELFLARFPTAPVAARASRACENAR
jgi:hypothetical protein